MAPLYAAYVTFVEGSGAALVDWVEGMIAPEVAWTQAVGTAYTTFVDAAATAGEEYADTAAEAGKEAAYSEAEANKAWKIAKSGSAKAMAVTLSEKWKERQQAVAAAELVRTQAIAPAEVALAEALNGSTSSYVGQTVVFYAGYLRAVGAANHAYVEVMAPIQTQRVVGITTANAAYEVKSAELAKELNDARAEYTVEFVMAQEPSFLPGAGLTGFVAEALRAQRRNG